MILVVTLVAMMGLAKMLLNSFVMLSGSTMVTYMQQQTRSWFHATLKYTVREPPSDKLKQLVGGGGGYVI